MSQAVVFEDLINRLRKMREDIDRLERSLHASFTGGPIGPAGGVLSGSYPNPAFAQDMATQTELNAVQAASVNDGDAAGGVLGGAYPNPAFAVDMATQAELDAAVAALEAEIAGISAESYLHNQASSATVWTVAHNLNKEPVSVTIEDSAHDRVIADIEYIDTNNLTITFGSAMAGFAYVV